MIEMACASPVTCYYHLFNIKNYSDSVTSYCYVSHEQQQQNHHHHTDHRECTLNVVDVVIAAIVKVAREPDVEVAWVGDYSP